MKHIFIINPAAGRQNNSLALAKSAENAALSRGIEAEIYFSRYPGHITEMVRDICQKYSEDAVRIYACGGDGTLNEALSGTAGFLNASVTHYPCGTGNDFIRVFKEKASGFHDLGRLIDGSLIETDLISCKERYAVNICSVGFDARIAAEMAKFKRLPFVRGNMAYNLSLIKNLILGIDRKYRVRVDGESFDGNYTMLVAANGSWYGGGYHAVPDADIQDGLLDFLLVKKVSRFKVAGLVGLYAKGRYKELPEYITHIRGKRIEIEADVPFAVNMDGEIHFDKATCFELSEKKLKFITPAEYDSAPVFIESSIPAKIGAM